jgi:hypothetical protein
LTYMVNYTYIYCFARSLMEGHAHSGHQQGGMATVGIRGGQVTAAAISGV